MLKNAANPHFSPDPFNLKNSKRSRSPPTIVVLTAHNIPCMPGDRWSCCQTAFLSVVLAGETGLHREAVQKALQGRLEVDTTPTSGIVCAALCIRASAEGTVLRHKHHLLPAGTFTLLFLHLFRCILMHFGPKIRENATLCEAESG